MRNAICSLILMFGLVSGAIAGSIDINTADVGLLESELVGIGADKAAAIVQYREKHGPFKSVDELVKVKGIGEKILDKNKDNLTVAQ